MVCVLPVPGGPSIMMIYGVRALINNVAGDSFALVCVIAVEEEEDDESKVEDG